MNIAEELKARGLVENSSAPLETILGEKRTIYLGVDPSAESMHAGNLLVVLLLKRLADAGHNIVLLVGGGTGMIGDPRESGERTLADAKIVKKNSEKLKAQMQKIIGKKITVVNNADWLTKLSLIDFLRDIGKHFTINELIKRDIIKRRLETPDESISYTEFAYSLLQGFDFLHLFKTKGVDVQIGGNDQWTNILSGVELIRRKLGKEAFCFTSPIITDSTGKKFGKSEGNAVWLDEKKTSPFKFYQFWINLPDVGLENYLRLYTFLSVSEINSLMELHKRSPGDREAQETLARLVTEIVHGPIATAQAVAATDALFGGRTFDQLSREEVTILIDEVNSCPITESELETKTVADLAVSSTLASSKSDAKRLIEGKGLTINGTPVTSPDQKLTKDQFVNTLAILRKGKKDACIVTLQK